MRFRPCIDIHNGKVKQIVGGTLRDEGDAAAENFVSEQSAADFARMYAGDGLRGGHVILLSARTSRYYPQTLRQAMDALAAAPGLLQAGGGITSENALSFLNGGASHVIVTSYVFRDGGIDREALRRIAAVTGREHLVLDLSCVKKTGQDGRSFYRIVTDRWQKETRTDLDEDLLEELSGYCDEFLVHAVNAEGRRLGPDKLLAGLLGRYAEGGGIPVTYAGGIGSFEDLEQFRASSRGAVDVTVGSALDIFGGTMSYRRLVGLA